MIPPQTPVENTLARLWSEVLGVTDVGRDDNFFALGGHSLLVVKLLERIRRAGFAADVPTVFSNPVLSAMAAAITMEAGEDTAAETGSGRIPAGCNRIDVEMVSLAGLTQGEVDAVCAVVPGGAANVQDIYPLLHQQEGILFHHQLAGDDAVDAYQVRWIMAIDGRERLDRVLAALQSAIDRHDALRTLVLWERLTHPVQVVCRRAQMIVHEVGDLGGRQAIECLTDLTDRRRMRLPLTKAPLLTAFVARDTDRDTWHLAMVVHHIVIDHVSLGILGIEVRSAVTAASAPLAAPRPFRDVVSRILAAGATDSEAFFDDMLGDVEQPTLPFDLVDVQGDGSQIEEAVHALHEDLASRISAAALKHRISAAVLFHVAWGMVVARCSGQSDVVFGTVLYGRSDGVSGLGNTMGMLINTLPIRISLQDASPVEVLKATYQRLSQLMRHEHASLAQAQRCSKVTAPTPLFSALLNYRHVAADWAGGESGGPSIEGVRVELGEAAHELSADDGGRRFWRPVRSHIPI